MFCNNPLGLVNHGVYRVCDENLYFDRNISLAIPWDMNLYRFSSYRFVYLKEEVLNFLKEILRRKLLKKIHSFLEKQTISRGKKLLYL